MIWRPSRSRTLFIGQCVPIAAPWRAMSVACWRAIDSPTDTKGRRASGASEPERGLCSCSGVTTATRSLYRSKRQKPRCSSGS